MDDANLCVETCKASGWLGEVVVVLLVGARALWAERKRRELAKEKEALTGQKAELSSRLEALSLRPPPVPVTIQMGGAPSMATAEAAQASVQPTEAAQEIIPPDRGK